MSDELYQDYTLIRQAPGIHLNLFEPHQFTDKAGKPNGNLTFGLTLLLHKQKHEKDIKNLCEAARFLSSTRFDTDIFKDKPFTFMKDGDGLKHSPGYEANRDIIANHVILRLKTKAMRNGVLTPLSVVDEKIEPITSQILNEPINSGCLFKALFTLGTYVFAGKPGVTSFLNIVQVCNRSAPLIEMRSPGRLTPAENAKKNFSVMPSSYESCGEPTAQHIESESEFQL